MIQYTYLTKERCFTKKGFRECGPINTWVLSDGADLFQQPETDIVEVERVVYYVSDEKVHRYVDFMDAKDNRYASRVEFSLNGINDLQEFLENDVVKLFGGKYKTQHKWYYEISKNKTRFLVVKES